MRLAGSERDRKRLARREQMALPDHFGNRFRAQAVGERRCRSVGSKKIGHGASMVTANRTAPALTLSDGTAYIDGVGFDYPAFSLYP